METVAANNSGCYSQHGIQPGMGSFVVVSFSLCLVGKSFGGQNVCRLRNIYRNAVLLTATTYTYHQPPQQPTFILTTAQMMFCQLFVVCQASSNMVRNLYDIEETFHCCQFSNYINQLWSLASNTFLSMRMVWVCTENARPTNRIVYLIIGLFKWSIL